MQQHNSHHQTNKANQEQGHLQAPTKAFRFAAVGTLIIGVTSFAIGLINADMLLNEKGYYLACLLFGLFSAVSVQKSVRDKAEGVKTSNIYYLLAWIASASAISLLCVGLYHGDLTLSEKGFFGMAFLLSLFAAVTVQKNVRDIQSVEDGLQFANKSQVDIFKGANNKEQAVEHPEFNKSKDEGFVQEQY